MSECRNDCPEPLLFPKRPNNRPSLSHINYRIGTYSDFREVLFHRLNLDAILGSWTHREPDDPGIALLEGASTLADILTFYQELYANEAYLRTARWRESVAGLVRLLGYRLSPGLGGRATFAFEVKGDVPVTIPEGFQIKAQVEGLEKQAEFETTDEATAYPWLSRLHLYRPRLTAQSIASGSANNSLEIGSVDGKSDAESIAAVEIKEGDRIMLVPDATMFDVNGTSYSAQKKPEILIVKQVKTVVDRTIITFEGSLIENRGTQVAAYRIGRSFRHFGHHAPVFITKVNDGEVTQEKTDFMRDIFATHQGTDYYPRLTEKEMPLDQEVDDLAAGGTLICQGLVQFDGQSSPVPFAVVKQINDLRSDSMTWGNVTGSSTVVTVDSKLVANESILNEASDIRQMRFHEATSVELRLRAPSRWGSGAFADTTLMFFGTYEEASALAGRSLLLKGEEGNTEKFTVSNEGSGFSLVNKDDVNSWLWPLTLDHRPESFSLEDFDEENPSVTVYGNLVEATQGKTEKDALLGDGKSGEEFQTFKLPRAPLTYLNAVGETPPEVPELAVFVDDIQWTRVPSLFGRTGEEQIYIVREDANGDSWVQFGDGKTGAKLPSGKRNVMARFRTGTGAYGDLKADTTVQGGKLRHLDKIQLPGVATGGSDAESGVNAKQAAPGKIQSLDRLVSLRDFEHETLAISGVSKVRAAWDLVDNVPSIVLTVLMESGRGEEIEEIRSILNGYNRCRGPQRFPISVVQGRLRYTYLDLEFGLHPAFQGDLVKEDIQQALGVSYMQEDELKYFDGLFSPDQRYFAQREHATRIEGTAQNVDGVVWAKVLAFGFLGDADDPTELGLPSEPKPLNSSVNCDSQHVLSLYIEHLSLKASAVLSGEACSDE